MSDAEFAQLRERLAEFEAIIQAAKEAQWAGEPSEVGEHFLRHDPVLAWRLLDFLDAYEQGGVYPVDRLAAIVDRLIDTKLQLYFVTQVLPGTMNAMVYVRGFEESNPLVTPSLQLARLAYAQAMIGAVRVLWERLMRLIHFLEVGSDADGKHTQRVFFRELPKWSPRWDVLAEFQSEINRYDESYRTPEYHKGSILKRELLGGATVDINEVLGLITPITSGVWTVPMSNVRGEPHTFLGLGRHVRIASDGS
jgi:hypothetical protein